MKKYLALGLLAGVLAMPSMVWAQYVTNVVVPSNSVWRVYRGVSEASTPTNAWRSWDYDDSAWERLAMPLHYGTNSAGGDDDQTGGTILSDMKGNYTVVYSRASFVLTNASLVKNLTLRLSFDDGFVAWINSGSAVRFLNTWNPATYSGMAFNTNATKDAEAVNSVYTGIPGYILRDGTNVIGIQAFNFSRTNDDFRINAQLEALYTTNLPLRVASLAPDPASPVTNLSYVTVTFSQRVTNVHAGDLLVNGLPASRVSGSGAVYTFGFPTPDSPVVECAWSEDRNFRDTNSVGLGWQPAGWSYTHQVAYPEVAAVAPAAGTRVTNLNEVTVTFNRGVTNVEAADLLMDGNPAVGLSLTNQSFVFSFSGPPEGPVVMSWDPALAIQDTNGLPFVATNLTWQYTFLDLTPPRMLALTPAPGTVVGLLTEARVTFSEPVSGVDAADLLMNGRPALEVVGSGAGPYVFQFEAPEPGNVALWWVAGHGIRDVSAARNLFPGGSWDVVLDSRLTSPVIISEFQTSNVSTNGHRDEDGELQEWIELNNRGSNAVRLLGWSLTDDTDAPDQWIFPDVTMQPGSFLIVYASGKDRRAVGGTNRLHANFGLNPDGEYLGLFNADSPRQSVFAFSPRFPAQRADYSYGVTPSNQWRYFRTPTPGAPNGESPIATALPDVHFNVTRGILDTPFPLLLSVEEPGARIRYTTNGTLPTESNGADYTNALVIGRTTALRAGAFKTNMLPSLVQTHTYLFLDDILRQSGTNLTGVYTNSWSTNATYTAPDYDMDPKVVTNPLYRASIKGDLLSIPTISVVLKPDDLFSTNNGIYTHTIQDGPYRGPLWTRSCSAEWINPDGSPGFQIDCGLRMQGGGSRDQNKEKKHPFALSFKGEYGASKLKYRVFQDSPVSEFDNLYLRAEYNNHWSHSDGNQRARGAMVRDELFKDLMGKMGAVHSHATYAHLYINGIYWGVYGPAERQDGSFGAAYFGGDKSDYDAVNGTGGQIVDGDNTARATMISLAAANLADPAAYAALGQYLDIPQYIDYLILQYYGGNQDWGTTKNWYALRRRQPGAGFMYVAWDSERTLEDPAGFPMGVTNVAYLNTVSPDNLQSKLIGSPEYRLAFADHVQKHMFNGGALTPASIMAAWVERSAMVYRALVCESARWGDVFTPTAPYTRNGQYATETNRLFTAYFPARTANVLNQFRLVGLYPTNVTAPAFSQHGGAVARGCALTITSPDPVYYTLNGSDPRTAGSGAVSSLARAYTNGVPVILDGTTPVKARALQGTTNWSALVEATFTVQDLLPMARFTEIMFNPAGGDAYEFVEIRNLGALPVDLGNYTLDGLTYVFPPRSVLNPGAVWVLASATSPAAFRNRYPGVGVFGWYAGHLDNGGQRLGLKDGAGRTVTSVDYNDSNGWPKAADGAGYSLEVVNAAGNPDDPANWQASTALNGTPGVIPAPHGAPVVRLSELMAGNITAVNHEGFYPDWVELVNTSSNQADVGLWSLSVSDNPRSYVIPAGTRIDGGGHLIIWCDPAGTYSGLRAGFGLNRDGEFLYLYDAQTNRVDAVSYGMQIIDYSLAWVDGAWRLGLPTPEADNLAAPLAPAASLVINEWMADSLPGQDDWLELFNRSATLPAALQNCYLGTSNQTHQYQWLSFLPPGGYLQLRADQNAGAKHLDFKLPNSYGGLFLFDPAGMLLDSVSYGATFQGVSMGRLPDGGSAIASFPGSPSPGASNYLYAYTGPVINEVMAVNRLAWTNQWGNTADWVELYNPGPGAFDLTGMSVSDDANSPGQWVFPAGSLLPGGGYVILGCDPSQPASGAWGLEMNLGRSLDGNNGGIWLFSAAGQPVDSVEWGFQVADLSIGRCEGPWRLLAAPTPGASNAAAALLGGAQGLRINEWMANPAQGDDWVELYNPDTRPVELSGLYLSDSPLAARLLDTPVAPLSFIGAGGFTKWVADGLASQGRNHTGFQLDSQGEAILLYSAAQGILDVVYYGPQQLGASQGRLPDGGAAIAGFPDSASPGESNYLPLGDALVNEVLPLALAPFEPAIEFHNPSLNPVDLGGMYLSDSTSDLKKYRVPDLTVVAAGGFVVFYQSQFNATPGAPESFVLNPAGGTVVLSAVDDSEVPTGWRAQAVYGPSEAGVSQGRFVTSTGVDFVALSQPSFGVDSPVSVEQFRLGAGAPNAYPKVGPLILSEIQYHPAQTGGTNDNSHDEFIEVSNVTEGEVVLSAGPGAAWQLGGAVQYVFPEGAVIPAAGSVVLVGFDPMTPGAEEAFRLLYQVPDEVPVAGPWTGQLNNAGESLELYKPGGPGIPPVLADRVVYSPRYPWPMGADGGGASLQRTNWLGYGNEPLNWAAQAPTAGRANTPAAGAAPVVRSAPADVVVRAGESAQFSVSADGAGPIRYQWRYNGAWLEGQTNPVLLLEAVDATRAGNYSVAVSNQYGGLFWAAGSLTVLTPPQITVQPTNTTVVAGSPAVFTVVVVGDSPLRYRWRRNGIDIDNAEAPALTLAFAQLGDAADYTVVIANSAGSATSHVASLTVLAPARISAQPASQTVEFGDPVQFEVSATGSSPLRYQWVFNGVPIPNATNTIYRIELPVPASAGAYAAAVDNGAGGEWSQSAALMVLTTRDSDHDGLTDYQEYLAGTDPRDPASLLTLEALPGAGEVRLRFQAAAGRSYSILHCESFQGGQWEVLTNIAPPAVSGAFEVADPSVGPAAQRFYRLVTPQR